MIVHISDVFELICIIFKATFFSTSRVLYLLSDRIGCLKELNKTLTEHAHVHITKTELTNPSVGTQKGYTSAVNGRQLADTKHLRHTR